MKKIVIRIVVGAVALVLVALLVLFFSLNSIVKKGVETVGPKLTKSEIRLKSAKLSPLSGHGELTGLFVGNPEGFKSPSAIQVGDIKVGVEPSSLFSGTIAVDEVNIQGPEITFEGSLTGGNNLSKLLDNINAASGGEKDEKTSQKSEKKFFVKELLIKDGKINLSVSTPLGSKTGTLPLPEVHVQNIGSREKGVTAAELVTQIMQPLLASATKAAAEGVANLGKSAAEKAGQAGQGAVDEVNKATKGLKDLFKK